MSAYVPRFKERSLSIRGLQKSIGFAGSRVADNGVLSVDELLTYYQEDMRGLL